MKIIKQTTLRSGQVRAYGDSVYEYEILTTPGTEEEVWEICQGLKRAQHRNDKAKHDGACGFEFRLDSFGSLKTISENRYRYTVTQPYCD